MGRILAIDYGQKRVGLAMSDPLKIIANPLKTVHVKDVFDELKKLMDENEIECIVVGEPKQMNYQPSESARFIEPFVKKLRKTYPNTKIDRCDERFTSMIAKQTILMAGKKKKDRQNKALVDTVSATIILQSYMLENP